MSNAKNGTQTTEKPDRTSENDSTQAMGMGIGVGIAIGAAIGVALDNLALGMGIGIAMGVAIGSGWGAANSSKEKSDAGSNTKESRDNV